jgi:YVTN family beta-propeller protein
LWKMLQFDVRYLVCVVYLLYLTQSVAVRTEVGVAITAEKVNATGKEGMVQQGIEVAYVAGYSFMGNGLEYGTVSVVDVTTNAIIATFSIGRTSAEVVVTLDGTRAYVRDVEFTGKETIFVIDTATNNVLATIPAGVGPSKLAISSDETRIYMANWGSRDLTVIHTVTNLVITTVPLEDRPMGVAVTRDGTWVYVITEGIGAFGNVHVINAATHRVMFVISVGFSPSGIVVTPDGSRVYVVNNPLLGVENCVIRIIDTVENEVAHTILVGPPNGGKPNMVIAPDGTRVYVSASIYMSAPINLGHVLLYVDTATDEATNSIILSTFYGAQPGEMILSPDGTQICIVCNEGIWIVDTETKQLIGTIPMRRPNRIAFTSDGTKVYGIVQDSARSIAMVDIATRTVTYIPVNFYLSAITIARINSY